LTREQGRHDAGMLCDRASRGAGQRQAAKPDYFGTASHRACVTHGLGWSVTVNGSDVPMWVSAVALVVFAGLAVGLWREMRV
jgi:hypothetical protein